MLSIVWFFQTIFFTYLYQGILKLLSYREGVIRPQKLIGFTFIKPKYGRNIMEYFYNRRRLPNASCGKNYYK